MALTLTIENVASLTSGDPVTMVLNEHGLVIGRAAHADWTLPDQRNHISSLHAEIDFVDGRYMLTDRSTNGTFVNGGGARLSAPYEIRNGDLITIGPYEIRAALTGGAAARGGAAASASAGGGLDWLAAGGAASQPADHRNFGREAPRPLFQSSSDPLMGNFAMPAAAPAAADPFGLSGAGAGGAESPFGAALPNPFGVAAPQAAPAFEPPATPAFAPPPPSSAYAPAPAGDPFGLSGGGASPAPNPFGLGSTPAPATDPFGVATAQPQSPANPAPAQAAADPWASLHRFDAIDFAAAAAGPPEAAPAPPTPASAATAPSDSAAFEAFLHAAGLKPKDVADQPADSVLAAAGRLLRQTADGLIRLLDARARIRHQFGVGAQVTSFQRTGNNPLKWTRSPEQALRQLVGEPDPGFLDGPTAVRGAFEDLQAHEAAMLAAMQEAIAATVERFSPDAIRTRVQARSGLLPGSKEAALWRAFEAEFKAMAAESEAAYLDLFARHFRRAYERNIKRADG